MGEVVVEGDEGRWVRSWGVSSLYQPGGRERWMEVGGREEGREQGRKGGREGGSVEGKKEGRKG